ncbi:hypothetical protein [Nocardia phage P3.1]|nr:hypothetical protein [Nocardia phage P3.1]
MIVILGADSWDEFQKKLFHEIEKVGVIAVATAKETVDAVVEQLTKASGEIKARIDELEAKVNEGTVTAEDLQPLRDIAQALDDEVADVEVPEEPVEPEPGV